jgi:hypothetical protein
MPPPDVLIGHDKTLARALSCKISGAVNDASLHHVPIHALRSLNRKAWHVIPLYHPPLYHPPLYQPPLIKDAALREQ